MALWGNNDQSNNAPLYAAAQFNLAPNTDNRDALFNNNTPDAFVDGETVGSYGVSKGELSGSGEIADVNIDDAGTGFTAVPNVDVDNSGTEGNNFAATVILGLVGVAVNTAGSGYTFGDNVTINSNAATNAEINVSGISTISGQDETAFNDTGANGTFVAGSDHAVGDELTLSDGTVVNVTAETSNAVTQFDIISGSANADAISENNPTLEQESSTGAGTGFSLTLGNNNQEVAAVSIESRGVWEDDPTSNTNVSADGGNGSSLTLDVDYGIADVNVTNTGSGYTSAPSLTVNGNGTNAELTAEDPSSAAGDVAHAGWVIKREGTGGRAGRVQYETLVAGDLGGDADDKEFPE